MKDVLIIANFCRDFSVNDNGRFMYLCKELSKNNNVEIITSDFRHSTKTHKEKLNTSWPFKITFLHEIGYMKNISIRRFYSHYTWGKQVKKYLKKRKKPDVIYCAVPSLTAPLMAANYCNNRNVKFIIDIQDLWPEAFKMAFHFPILSNLVFLPFNMIANHIYKKADKIIGVSNTYVSRGMRVNKKCNEGLSVYLGTNLNSFDEFCKSKKYIKNDEIWLGYCGSLSTSYDLTVVFDALELLQSKRIEIPTFMIMGNGQKMEEFEKYAKKKKIKTVFTGRLAYDEMCAILSQCDIVVNPISHNAAQSIINKVGDYAAAGVPVLNTQECQEYRDIVESYNMGINCKNNDPADLAEKLEYLLENQNVRIQMGKGARKCAEELFDRAHTYQKIIDLVVEK